MIIGLLDIYWTAPFFRGKTIIRLHYEAIRLIFTTSLGSVHTEPYPIPTTYPEFFSKIGVPSSLRRGISIHPEYCSVFSSLVTSSQTANLFSSHASAIHNYLKRKPSVEALGFDGDDLRGLVNDLWTLHDNFDGSFVDEEAL